MGAAPRASISVPSRWRLHSHLETFVGEKPEAALSGISRLVARRNVLG